MNENSAPISQPTQMAGKTLTPPFPVNPSLQVPPTQPPPPPAGNMQRPPEIRNKSPYLLGIIMFIVGIVCGILLFITYPRFISKTPVKTQSASVSPTTLTLPKDAVMIQDCVDNKGALFAKSKDLSKDPIYMVYQNKIIGLEYSFFPDDFDNGNLAKDINTQDLKINHVNTSVVFSSQSDSTSPQAYIDFYFIDPNSKTKIKCEKPTPSDEPSSSSASLTVSPEISISPEISQPEAPVDIIELSPIPTQ